MSSILEDREKRFYRVKELVNEYHNCLILKGNIPGENKTIKEVYLLLTIFNHEITKRLKNYQREFYNSFDGPYFVYYNFKEPVKRLKEEFIKIEETHPLGRLIDIDVYSKGKTITRASMDLPQRKCLLCGNVAWLCMKERKHSVKELTDFIISSTNKYLHDDFDRLLTTAFLSELNLHPKFGLVTPYSNGSHDDMNYHLMLNSLVAIKPYLLKLYQVGFQTSNIKKGFVEVRKIGIEAEKAMYKVTKGVNTYKGAIFLIGIMIYSLGYYGQNKGLDYPKIIKTTAKNILDELEGRANTFGIYAYQQFKMYTIRHEVYYGIPSVYEAYEYLDKFKELNSEALLMTLIFIIKQKKDTVALKRAKTMKNYNKWVAEIAKITKFNLKKIEATTNSCIKNKISFGGSADILIAAVFLRLITKKGYLTKLA
ncbi:MAG: citrate lyase holo-[acyl-carrier protein] synthase [Acholeplasmatales bacterium]|jgi:holo-ACP synthase CitX|nr:citrate lyase holo-[acyl-carrier protein] synthase [Acholeplasmataceae bacterium]MCK9289798.1 citrate lyase holo-[acyl-carrier protein] synthase [Acholeplasmataceae bacterium]MCK9427893.1 citrate lyase holo-[acyl-carrier protein] synthase [Acholeplasmataceae bacterium]MDY0114969.1 citrate lyase holo-[acyl-carrier protein] synthase [Acholeplasmatales bacterium]HHT39016.1 citrate lyase holo-[acyl-carrier protein] synthase [Acholeplasmataceae bacterium]